jgi:transcriptional regulator with XRE-family HTH domain
MEGIGQLQANAARNLKALRLKRKLSQDALAAKAGISTSYVSELERGNRSPPLDTIEKLAMALGVPPQRVLADQ